MKKLLISFLLLGFFSNANAQLNFGIELEETSITNLYGVQSFASGQLNGEWFIFGGRTDGLHQRQPFAAFAASDNHSNILRINPQSQTFSTASVSTLPTKVQEQMLSTNINFCQVDENVYLIGGFGYSNTTAGHVTHNLLTVVNLPTLKQLMDNNQDVSGAFSYIEDVNMTVTGGYLHHLNDTFYLVGGQEFQGSYNPMGPTHGPGFFQQYTEEIRKFQVANPTTNPTIVNYHAIKDTDYLHRRDYNVGAQIFPDGSRGFTAFSGVFQKTVDLPWEDGVDITENGYEHRPDFSQKLSQYHSAKLPIYDSTNTEMHTMIFGGIAQYFFQNGTLTSDPNVPFVKTISVVTRDKNNLFTEQAINIEMPAYLGASAEFFPIEGEHFDHQQILHLDKLPDTKTLVGYIFGGIESSGPNIFFSNTGTQSGATNKIFKVYVDKSLSTSVKSVPAENELKIIAGLDIEKQLLKVTAVGFDETKLNLEIFNMKGKLVYQSKTRFTKDVPAEVSLDEIQCKMGVIRLSSNNQSVSTKMMFR